MTDSEIEKKFTEFCKSFDTVYHRYDATDFSFNVFEAGFKAGVESVQTKPMTKEQFYDWIDDYTENGSGTGCWATDEGIEKLISLGLIKDKEMDA